MRHEGSSRLQTGTIHAGQGRGAGIQSGVTLESLSMRSLARLISYIPQHTGISMAMSVLDVVLMGFNPWLGLLEKPDGGSGGRRGKRWKCWGLVHIYSGITAASAKGRKGL